jgi:uncharacterized protein
VRKLTAACLVLAAIAAPAFAAEEIQRTLTVTGTAEVTVIPDICYLSFGVTTEHKTSAGQAYKDNNLRMDALRAAIRSLGVEENDMQSRNFSVSPRYRYESRTEKRVFEGYSVHHTLAVNLRKLDKATDVLDAAMAAGASEVSSVTFTVENPKKYLGDARVEAIKAAQKKAETMAQAAGVTLLKPTSIYENEPGNYRFAYAQTANAWVDETTAGEGGASLAPGETKLSLTVNITYEIK